MIVWSRCVAGHVAVTHTHTVESRCGYTHTLCREEMRLHHMEPLRRRPVRSHAALCAYLCAKHPAARVEQLPFGGKNTVVYVTSYGLEESEMVPP